jgi:pSer/pThr/pTyr-binding forkhead associated (FHA) protein
MGSTTVFEIIEVDGTKTRRRFDIPRIVFGRDKRSVHLHVDESLASRRHGELVVGLDSVMVRDSGSTNGTWQNGLRYDHPFAILVGESFMIGGLKIRLAQLNAVPKCIYAPTRPQTPEMGFDETDPALTPVLPGADNEVFRAVLQQEDAA